jgi:3-isopropylmalate/(R)-2-methylmalate dehydratase small subunit
MDKFTKLTGVAAPMPLINVDTDMIIPKQFLKTIKRSGLGKNLFDEMRYDDDGNEIADFVLNKPAYREAQILVAGDNFGCGSSREHAPWALLDFGIRCVIAPSFADIFFNNCFKNGILPIVLPQEDVDKLMDDAEPRRERRGFGGPRKPDDHRAGWRIDHVSRSIPSASTACSTVSTISA